MNATHTINFKQKEQEFRIMLAKILGALCVSIAALVILLVVPVFPSSVSILLSIALGALAYKVPKLSVMLVFLGIVLGYAYQLALPIPVIIIMSLVLFFVSFGAEAGSLLGMSCGILAAILMITPLFFMAIPLLIAVTLFRSRGKSTGSTGAIIVFLMLYIPLYVHAQTDLIPTAFMGHVQFTSKSPVNVVDLSTIFSRIGESSVQPTAIMNQYLDKLSIYFPTLQPPDLLGRLLGLIIGVFIGVSTATAFGVMALSRWAEKRAKDTYQLGLWLSPSLAVSGGVLVFLILFSSMAAPFQYTSGLGLWPIVGMITMCFVLGGIGSSIEYWLRRRDLMLNRPRIDTGISMMIEAEKLWDQRNYYRAKEKYREAQGYFEHVNAFAYDHDLVKEKLQADKLIESCTKNAKISDELLLGNQPTEESIIKVIDIPKGDDKRQGTANHPEDNEQKMKQLAKELNPKYGEITWLPSGGDNFIGLAHKDGVPVILRLPQQLEKRSESFVDECAAWRNLGQHRNIVTLIGSEIAPPLLKLEYVDGGNLSDCLAQRNVQDIRIWCRIINDIARGLEYAHSQKIYHGDLKPRNILLTKTMEVKITDWNLGKSFTPGYAAPEQFDRESPNEKTDVYQLAVIFYEMICGENPFNHGNYPEKEKLARELIPRELSSYSAKYKPLDDLMRRCLNKNPNARPTIKEFRMIIYQYMKEQHHESISVSLDKNDKKNLVAELSDLAVLAAKQNEPVDLEATLKSLLFTLPPEQAKKLLEVSTPKIHNITINYNNTYHDSVVAIKTNPNLPEHVNQDRIIHETETIVRGAMQMAMA